MLDLIFALFLDSLWCSSVLRFSTEDLFFQPCELLSRLHFGELLSYDRFTSTRLIPLLSQFSLRFVFLSLFVLFFSSVYALRDQMVELAGAQPKLNLEHQEHHQEYWRRLDLRWFWVKFRLTPGLGTLFSTCSFYMLSTVFYIFDTF